MSAQEPINGLQKVDGDEAGEELFEPAFNCGVFREINKVINVESNGKRGSRDVRGGIVGVAYAACEHAWIQGVGFEANALENRRDLVVPVAWASAETVQRFLEEPIFVLGGIRIANWRLHDSDLIVGEDTLTKGVLAVALLEGASLFVGKTDHYLHQVRTEDGYVLLGYCPDAILMVAKVHNVGFSAKRVEHVVFLYGEHTHCRNSLGNSFCLKGTVVGKVNLDVFVL